MRLAYFGYAGDPSHAGHLLVVEWLAERYDLVLVGLSVAHAFGKKMASLEYRTSMSEALLSQAKSRNIHLVNVEANLAVSGPVYSYDVLVALREMYPADTIHLAIGPDNADPSVWSRFKNAERISAEFGTIVAPDMGGHRRSTNIRALIAAGVGFDELAEIATPAVAALLIGGAGHYSASRQENSGS